MTLEDFFKANNAQGVSDFSLRANINPDGVVAFYIHPERVSGDTLDCKVTGNTLHPAGWYTGWLAPTITTP